MPIYKYRSKEPGCEECAKGLEAFQQFSAEPHTECPFCEAPIYRSIQRVGIKIRRALHGADGLGNDYREDLARFPGDPEAYVTGPRSLQRLIDKRKRAGWSISKEIPTLKKRERPTRKELVLKAYERAKAKGFRFDHEIEGKGA